MTEYTKIVKEQNLFAHTESCIILKRMSQCLDITPEHENELFSKERGKWIITHLEITG